MTDKIQNMDSIDSVFAPLLINTFNQKSINLSYNFEFFKCNFFMMIMLFLDTFLKSGPLSPSTCMCINEMINDIANHKIWN